MLAATIRNGTIAALGVAFGSACTTMLPAIPAPGSAAGTVRTQFGSPTAEHALASGSRLEYSGGTYGKHTWMFDFDAAGALRASAQVRTEESFNAVRSGMSADEVRTRIGSPSDRQRIAWQRQDVWSYRYVTPFCQWFRVGIDEAGKVVDSGYGPDPLCESKDVGRNPK